MNTVRLCLRFGLLVSFALLIVGCTPASVPKGSPTPTGNAVPVLGSVPQNCPAGPTPRRVSPAYGPVIGGSPLWATSFDGPHATVHLSSTDPYTQYGWTYKVLWIMEPGFTKPITLHGENVRNGTPIYFNVVGQTTSAPVLDRSTTGTPFSQWTDFPSHIFIPMAGCYSVEGTWPGGHWQVTFAAGQ